MEYHFTLAELQQYFSSSESFSDISSSSVTGVPIIVQEGLGNCDWNSMSILSKINIPFLFNRIGLIISKVRFNNINYFLFNIKSRSCFYFNNSFNFPQAIKNII